MFNALPFLSQKKYRIYHMDIARKLGSIHAAILLMHLVDLYDFYQEKKLLVDHGKHGPGWFYLTVAKCEEDTVLTEDNQETALEKLLSLGLLEKNVFGVPPKRHFRLKFDNIKEFFDFKRENPVSQKKITKAGNPRKQDPVIPGIGHIYSYPDSQTDQDVPEPEAFQESKRLLMANGVDEQGANALSPVHSLEEIKEVLAYFEKNDRSKSISSKGGWIADCLRKGWHKKEVEERPVIPAPVPVYVPDVLDRTFDLKLMDRVKNSYRTLRISDAYTLEGGSLTFYFKGKEEKICFHTVSDQECEDHFQKIKAFILEKSGL